jgi:hypothetical protein
VNNQIYLEISAELFCGTYKRVFLCNLKNVVAGLETYVSGRGTHVSGREI